MAVWNHAFSPHVLRVVKICFSVFAWATRVKPSLALYEIMTAFSFFRIARVKSSAFKQKVLVKAAGQANMSFICQSTAHEARARN